MAGPRSKSRTGKPREKKPRDTSNRVGSKRKAERERQADTSRKVAAGIPLPSQRANVRDRESESSFGLAGAGRNRAVLAAAGSPEAQNAINRPLTAAEARFGANPQTTAGGMSRLDNQSNAVENAFSSQASFANQSFETDFNRGGFSEQLSSQQPVVEGTGLNRVVTDSFETSAAVPGAGLIASGAKKLVAVARPEEVHKAGEVVYTWAKTAAGRNYQRQLIKNGPAPLPPPGAVSNTVNAKSTAETIPVNTKTVSKVKDYLKRIMLEGKQVIDPVTGEYVLKNNLRVTPTAMFIVAGTILGNKAFSMFLGKEEAGQAAAFGSSLALMNDRPDLALEQVAITRELLSDDSLVEKFFSWIPGVNIMSSITEEYIPAVLSEMDIIETLAEDQLSNLSEEDIYAARREQRIADDKLFSERQIATSKRIAQMKEDAAIRGDQRQITLLNERLKLQLEYEKEKLRLNNEYWNNYEQRSAEIRGDAVFKPKDTTPSKLSFGLL